MIIGLSGYARSGKDEAARVLVEEFGFTRIAFADKLREFLYALNPLVVTDGSENTVVETFGDFDYNLIPRDSDRLRSVIDKYGWDGYKKTPYGTEIRELLQRLGTEAGRQVLSDTIWIDSALNGLDPDGKYVITDVRFPNEADAVKARGGQLWRITRTGVGPANSHASETSLDNYDFNIELLNSGTVEEYRELVSHAFNAFARNIMDR